MWLRHCLASVRAECSTCCRNAQFPDDGRAQGLPDWFSIGRRRGRRTRAAARGRERRVEDSEQRDRHHDTDTWLRFGGLGSSGSALDAAQPEGLTRSLVSGGGDIGVGGVLVELLRRGQMFGFWSSVRLMSEREPSVEERDWPKRCPHCQTELQTATQGFNPAGEDDIDHGEMGEVLAVDFCPNPDCPDKETDPARASHDH